MSVHKSLQIKIHKFVGHIGQPKSSHRKRKNREANRLALSREAEKAGLTRAEIIKIQMEQTQEEIKGFGFDQSTLSRSESIFSPRRGRLIY